MFLKVSDHFMNLFSSPKALNLLILWRKGAPQISGGRAIFLHRRSVDKWDFLQQNVALILLEINQKNKTSHNKWNKKGKEFENLRSEFCLNFKKFPESFQKEQGYIFNMFSSKLSSNVNKVEKKKIYTENIKQINKQVHKQERAFVVRWRENVRIKKKKKCTELF